MWNNGGLFGSADYEINLDGKKLKGAEVWKYIDKKGAEGWELVSSLPEIHGHPSAHTAGFMLWFKRPC
jgi:hypothetical protein